MDSTPPRRLLGEILLSRKIITKEQLDLALKVQKNEERYLGEILTRLGYANERDIVVALVVQCNLPYIAVDKYEIDPAIAALIPKEKAWNYKLVPLDKVGDVLSVVMVNPLDQNVKDELQKITHCKIAPFIATQEEIVKALVRIYGE